VGRVPDTVAVLLTRVKEYERLTVRASLAHDADTAREALARNPLLPDRATADTVFGDLLPLW
jgi:alpha-galactosidase/6-phospho-beta-glucosidase family protein